MLIIFDYFDVISENYNNYKFQTLLDKLSKKNDLVILTNSGKNFRVMFERLLINKYFKKLYISGENNFIKPSFESFNNVLKDYKIDPKNCLFIDNTYSNFKNSKILGINSILYSNLENLENDLKKYF